jgi:hypothetical protein
MATKTPQVTMQNGVSNELFPVERCFQTRQAQLWYP